MTPRAEPLQTFVTPSGQLERDKTSIVSRVAVLNAETFARRESAPSHSTLILKRTS